MPSPDRIRSDLRAILDASRVIDNPAVLVRARRDTWVVSVWRSLQNATVPNPACVVRPATTSEVSDGASSRVSESATMRPTLARSSEPRI